ncbi:MAG: NADH-quinone oxidoreductase subunit NuoE [Anaerolineaceae bacterium]|nr:NADH-quinone oxidoreductase subunit NuoE [Anaerolineaceae bacterium]
MNEAFEVLLTEATRDRNALIPLLQRVQAQEGYVSKEAITAISRHLRLSTSEIFGVLTFYTQFRLKPLGRHTIKVCRGTACHVRGAPFIINAVEDELNLDGAEDTTPDGDFTFEKIACFGACALAPVVVIDEQTQGAMTPDKMRRLLRKITDQGKGQSVKEASHNAEA